MSTDGGGIGHVEISIAVERAIDVLRSVAKEGDLLMAAKKRAAGKSRKRPAAPTAKWTPGGTSFEAGEAYFKRSLREAGLDPDEGVFTSRDAPARKAIERLRVSSVPPGFKKWQLPFASYQPSNFYMTVGKPNALVESHAHEHGAGFRVILTGSLTLGGKKLGMGDWFYVPKGLPYAYKVGREGVQLMAGYECCCENWPCC